MAADMKFGYRLKNANRLVNIQVGAHTQVRPYLVLYISFSFVCSHPFLLQFSLLQS